MMATSEKVACVNCGTPYPDTGIPYRCENCGGLFDYRIFPIFDQNQLEPNKPGIWKYKSFLGLEKDAPEVYLGEGNTPLVWGNISGQPVAFKCEYQNPTGSFKDRGTAPIISFLLSRNCREAVEDSSGNAGASFAAYAGKAGIKARVFVPDSASGPKRNQIESYGAELVRVLGPRSNAAEAVKKAVNDHVAYASHAYLPFNLPGYATVAYELFYQLGNVPGTVVVPAGQAGLALGIGRGFEALYQSGITTKIPEVVAVQAQACAPLWALFQYGPSGLNLVAEGETIAEGIRVRYPLRGDTVLAFLERNRGKVLAVDDSQIRYGRDQLAKQGFYVETTSGIIWNAVESLIGLASEPVVAILTGGGLKNII